MFYMLDPSKKPKWIDLARVRGGEQTKPLFGIYAFLLAGCIPAA